MVKSAPEQIPVGADPVLAAWFQSYVDRFLDLDPEGVRNIELKRNHTARVVTYAALIADGEGLTSKECAQLLCAAQLHDVGRFPQYRRWRTFRDSDSDNHARLSLEVIREEQLLRNYSPEDRYTIEEAVRLHNVKVLPATTAVAVKRLASYLRDADKLDIWYVVLEYYRQPVDCQASAVGLGLPDRPEVTPACLAALAQGQVVPLEQAQVLNDFRLMQISWVYDLQSKTARRILAEKQYLEQLAAFLPSTQAVETAVARAIASLRTP